MDKRQWISFVSLSVALVALWWAFDTWYEKKHPPVVVPPVAADTQPATTEPAPQLSTPGTTAPTSPATPVLSAGYTAVDAADQAAPNIILGSAAGKDANYAMAVELTPLGAAIESVTLNDFPSPGSANAPKDKKAVYKFESPLAETPAVRVFATRQVVIDHKEIDLSSRHWTIVSADPESAQFSIYIDNGGGHVAKVTKTYRIQKRNVTDGSLGFEMSVSQEISDARTDVPKTASPLRVRAIINGPTPPPGELELGADRAVVVGYVDAKSNIAVEPSLLSEFKSEDAPAPHVEGNIDAPPVKEPAQSIYNKPFGWIGQSSTYFAAVVLPATPGTPNFNPRVVPVAASTADEHLAAMSFETTEQPLSPGAPVTTSMTAYFGPKWRNVLDTPHYTAFPRMYHKLLEIKSKMCGWATSDSLIAGLVWILRQFDRLFHDWGLSIICLVLIVRTLLHPITKRSQMQMMKMGKLSPEVEKLKKKYADQPDVLNREMMKLYKEQGGAILGCLPMFLQTPIWIALWSALQGTFELRQAPFLYGWTWIHDLARPDQLVDLTKLFGGPIPLYIFNWHLRAINLLPILMAGVTYVNQKYFMPTPIAATPEQEQQQKMQRGMSLFFPLMFYTMPSGLNLYYLTSMSLGIIESKIIRDHIKEQDELAKATGPEIVSMGKPPRGFRDRGTGGAGVPKGPKNPEDDKPGFMGRMMLALQKAQEQAEQIRKDKDKGKGK